MYRLLLFRGTALYQVRWAWRKLFRYLFNIMNDDGRARRSFGLYDRFLSEVFPDISYIRLYPCRGGKFLYMLGETLIGVLFLSDFLSKAIAKVGYSGNICPGIIPGPGDF